MMKNESDVINAIKGIKQMSPQDIKLFYYKNKDYYNVLHIAVKIKDYDLVKKILSFIKYYSNLSFLTEGKTRNNKIPLDLAVENNSNNIISLLLNSVKPQGLVNIKGSCYLNTVLQCLFHVKPLTLYFLEEKSNFYDNSFAKDYLSVIDGLIHSKNSFTVRY